MVNNMKNGSWIVTVRCVVLKELVVFNCTEEEAAKSPFDHASDERELNQVDYEVLSVEPNK